MATSITLEGMAQNGALAPEMTGEIFSKALEESVVGQVAGTTTMSMTGSEYVIAGAEPEADIVGEGQLKPLASMGFTTKVVRPVKAAVIVPWSKEARLKNPAGVFDDIQSRMSMAIQRQIDFAVLYGKGVKSGATIPGVDYLNQTTNRVALGTGKPAAGGLSADFLAGYSLVTDAGYDFSSFIADPRLRAQLMGAVDMQGRPVYQQSLSLGDPVSSFLGLPMAYGKSVSGRVGANPDTKVRAFGGDFSGNLRLGFVEQITFKTTDQATLIDGGQPVSLWQTNQEAALVEAIFGWVINNTKSFVAYEAAAEAPKA